MSDEPEVKPPCGNCACCSRWKQLGDDTACELDMSQAWCEVLQAEACGFAFDAGRELGRELRRSKLLAGRLRAAKVHIRELHSAAITFEAEYKRGQRCMAAVIDPEPDEAHFDDEESYFRHKAREALEARGWTPPPRSPHLDGEDP